VSAQGPYGPPQPPYGAGQPPYGPGQPPYGPPGWSAPPPYRENAPNAVLALVLGIVGIVLCQLAAPFAWALGRRAEEAVAAAPDRYTGKDMATAGKILGIVGTVLLALGVLALIVVVIVAIAGSSSSG
jgi:hypothetical protein